jgi:hypothetical protein
MHQTSKAVVRIGSTMGSFKNLIALIGHGQEGHPIGSPQPLTIAAQFKHW